MQIAITIAVASAIVGIAAAFGLLMRDFAAWCRAMRDDPLATPDDWTPRSQDEFDAYIDSLAMKRRGR